MNKIIALTTATVLAAAPMAALADESVRVVTDKSTQSLGGADSLVGLGAGGAAAAAAGFIIIGGIIFAIGSDDSTTTTTTTSADD